MDIEYVGIGVLVDRLGLSRSRIRQLDEAGVIPSSRRLLPGDRRIWRADEVEAIRETLASRRRPSREQEAPTAA